MAYPYTGTLNQNIITKGLFNMVISQRVFDFKVATPTLADMFRTDGTLFGDTKLFYSSDVGYPSQWASVKYDLTSDRLAPNLLALNRNVSTVCQSLKMGEYFFTSITTDQYLSKMAFMHEGTFSEMIGVLKAQLNNTNKIYDNALINTFVGTQESEAEACNVTITAIENDDPEVAARMTAQLIMQQLEIMKVNIADNSRDYNELGYLRSYDPSRFIAVWNIEQASKITKLDLPSLFHKEGVDATQAFKQVPLPSRWFGKTNATATEFGDDVRCAETGWYDVTTSGNCTFMADYEMLTDADKAKCIPLTSGDKCPATGETVTIPSLGRSVTVVSDAFEADRSYTVDPTILFKLVDREAIPYMSGFKTSTEFWNALSLTSNNYLMFGHNELERLKELPFMTYRLVSA